MKIMKQLISLILMNRNNMKRTTCFIFMIFVCVFYVNAQDVYPVKRTIALNEIQNEYLHNALRVSRNYFTLTTPISYNNNFFEKLRKNRVRTIAFAYKNNSPFYVNVNKQDKSHNDSETSLLYLFNESNGQYLLGVIKAISGDHLVYRHWLVSFNFNGDIIDYIPIREVYVDCITTIETQISADFTINVQKIEFPDNDCIIKDLKPLENLRGKRVDTSYRLNTEGRFIKTNEVHYKSQIYSSETLLNEEMRIAERGEIKDK